MAEGPQGQSAGRPPRPPWVKLLFVIALVAVVLVIIVAALADGEHGPSRHDPEGGNPGAHTPPVEHTQ